MPRVPDLSKDDAKAAAKAAINEGSTKVEVVLQKDGKYTVSSN